MRLFILLLVATGLHAQDPTDARGWLNRGVQSFRSGQFAEAVQAFERAVAADPTSVPARLYLGTAYMQQFVPGGQSPENRAMADSASREFLLVLNLESQNTVAIASLASLDLNQKNLSGAQQWYERLLTIDANNADAWYSLGFIAWSKWYPAYAAARKTLGMEQADPGPMPDSAVKQELKAKYYSVLDEGMRALQRALEIKPDYGDAMAYVNLLVRERADLKDTKAEYQQDIGVADTWVDKALAAKKAQAQARAGANPTPKRITIAEGVAAAQKIHDVRPVYPALASQAGITGTVRFALVIAEDGHVVNIQVISGHPLLIPAALDAIKQWQYRPMLVNGQPVEFATEASVNFPM